MVSARVGMVNARIEAAVRARHAHTDTIKAELLRLEGETEWVEGDVPVIGRTAKDDAR
jgi:hypothetical protein